MKHKGRGRTTDRAGAHELLGRAVRAGKAAGFRLADLAPTDGVRFLRPLAKLVAAGLVERVVEGCGKWHYRLTAAGRRAAKAKEPPEFAPEGDGDADGEDGD